MSCFRFAVRALKAVARAILVCHRDLRVYSRARSTNGRLRMAASATVQKKCLPLSDIGAYLLRFSRPPFAAQVPREHL